MKDNNQSTTTKKPKRTLINGRKTKVSKKAKVDMKIPKNEEKSSKKKTAKAEKVVEKTAEREPKLTTPRIILKVIGLLIWTGGALLAIEYALALLFLLILGRSTLAQPVWTTIANALIYTVAFAVIVFVPAKVFKKKKPTREELGVKGQITWADMLLAPAGFVVYLILALGLMYVFSKFSFFDVNEIQDLGYRLTTNFDRIVAYFALCIVAPIAEELIFRGWLYDKLRRLIPGKRLSLVLSILFVSVLFGVMHGQWNVGVNVFGMSIVLCILREITGTTYAGILLHILKNSVAFALVYILGFGM